MKEMFGAATALTIKALYGPGLRVRSSSPKSDLRVMSLRLWLKRRPGLTALAAIWKRPGWVRFQKFSMPTSRTSPRLHRPGLERGGNLRLAKLVNQRSQAVRWQTSARTILVWQRRRTEMQFDNGLHSRFYSRRIRFSNPSFSNSKGSFDEKQKVSTIASARSRLLPGRLGNRSRGRESAGASRASVAVNHPGTREQSRKGRSRNTGCGRHSDRSSGSTSATKIRSRRCMPTCSHVWDDRHTGRQRGITKGRGSHRYVIGRMAIRSERQSYRPVSLRA